MCLDLARITRFFVMKMAPTLSHRSKGGLWKGTLRSIDQVYITCLQIGSNVYTQRVLDYFSVKLVFYLGLSIVTSVYIVFNHQSYYIFPLQLFMYQSYAEFFSSSFLRLSSMANNNQHILGLATNFSFQILSINIKIETSNFCLWRNNIISVLETFDLESFILHPNPPPETITITQADAEPTIEANPAYMLWKKRDRYVLLWLKSTLAEIALAIVACSTSSNLHRHLLKRLFRLKLKFLAWL